MLDVAPPTTFAPRQSPLDHDAAGLARSFVDAIVGGDFDRLETLFARDVRFRSNIPAEYLEASTAAGARVFVEDWFGGTESRELIGWTVDPVGDRLAIGYRLELTEDGERRVVQQHAAVIIEGPVFRDVALVCSGVRPLAAHVAGDVDHDQASAYAPAARLDATGLSCATFTPTIAATVRGLDFGSVLEIVTDDPEAEEGLRSWTRLTGNQLVAAGSGPGSTRSFAIRRMPRDAATSTTKEAP
jgi:TusA-related sulfurtransferase